MIGFVLSGGINRGALQVGALQALAARGIKANLVAGTSAGALNGVCYAYDPTAAGLERLAQKWLNTKKNDIFPGNRLTMAWRVLTGQDSLVSGDNFRRTLEQYIPPEARTFRTLKVPFYAVTADVLSATTIIFGDDLDSEVFEPVLASASLPIVLPPVMIDGYQLIAGSVTAVAPIEVALLRGATELYVVDLEPDFGRTQPLHGVLPMAGRTLAREQLIDDLRDASQAGAIVHHVNITAFAEIALFDFGRTAQMIEAGRAAMDHYLANPRPNTIRPLAATGAGEASIQRLPRGGHPLQE
jgi:NTE family protein